MNTYGLAFLYINPSDLVEEKIDYSKNIYDKDIIFSNIAPKNMINYIQFLRNHHKYSWEKLLTLFPKYISTKKEINVNLI